jgi:cleavage stimulation factor subunit 3
MSEIPEAPALPLAEKSPADLAESDNDKTLPASEITTVLEQLNSSTEASQTQSQDPPSEWDLLRTQLDEKPHDPDGWRRLVEIGESSGDLEPIKKTYEALLMTYPHTVCAITSSISHLSSSPFSVQSSAQIAYISHFLNPGLFQYAEALFQRFLIKSPSVDLWKFYLTYVRFVLFILAAIT